MAKAPWMERQWFGQVAASDLSSNVQCLGQNSPKLKDSSTWMSRWKWMDQWLVIKWVLNYVLINVVYWDHNPFTYHLLSSWDIQVQFFGDSKSLGTASVAFRKAPWKAQIDQILKFITTWNHAWKREVKPTSKPPNMVAVVDNCWKCSQKDCLTVPGMLSIAKKYCPVISLMFFSSLAAHFLVAPVRLKWVFYTRRWKPVGWYAYPRKSMW